MAALDFPSAPTVGQYFVAGNGVTYQWNGTMWLPTGGTGALFIGLTPPSNPGAGQLWFNSEQARLYVYYNDGNTQQWVPSAPIPATGYVPPAAPVPPIGSRIRGGFSGGYGAGVWTIIPISSSQNDTGVNIVSNGWIAPAGRWAISGQLDGYMAPGYLRFTWYIGATQAGSTAHVYAHNATNYMSVTSSDVWDADGVQALTWRAMPDTAFTSIGGVWSAHRIR